MKRKFSPWVAVAISATSFWAFAQSPTGAGMGTSSVTPKMSANSQAENDYRTAQARCESQTGAVRTSCMNDATAAYDRALKTGPNSNAPVGGETGFASGTGVAGQVWNI